MKAASPEEVTACCGNCLMMLGWEEGAYCCAHHLLPTAPQEPPCELWTSPEGFPLPLEDLERLSEE